MQHYKKPLNTGANMSLVLKKEQLENQLQYGDEIGVYSSTNNLVGAFVYKGKTVVIPVYGNDEYSERQDGLLNNEALNLRYWSIKTKEEIKLASDWEQATVLYQQNSIQEFTIASPTENSNQVEFRIQPNPAKHSTILNFFLAESTVISLQLYDLMGKLIFEQNTLEFGKGKNSYTLKLDAFSAGTYLLKIQTNIAVYTKQLQMN